MGVISAGALIVGGVVTAVVSKLLADEAKAWLPHLSERLVARAAGKLPEPERERFFNEWVAELEAIPGDLMRLRYAAWLQGGANHMAADLTGEWPYSTVDAVFDRSFSFAVFAFFLPYVILFRLLVGTRQHMVCTFKRNGNFVHIQRTRVPEAPVVPVRYPAVVRFMVKTDLTGLYDFLQAIEAVLKGEAKMNLRQNLGAWLRSATLYMFKALFR